jgi:hypothetical protein
LPAEAATRVHFVRLDDPAASGLLITSNYVNGKYVYLLNAPPGRYGVVAAKYFQAGTPASPGTPHYSKKHGWERPPRTPGMSASSLTVYFPRALVDKTAVTVGAGDIAFMGEIVVDRSGGWAAADETQQLYYGLLAPGDRERNSVLKFLSSDAHVAAVEREVDRGPAAAPRFLNHSRIEFAGTGWDNRVLHPVGAGPLDE